MNTAESTSAIAISAVCSSRIDWIVGPQRFPDVPFDAQSGRLFMLTRSDVLRTLPSMTLPIRLLAVDAEGERTLGEFALQHTAFSA